MSQNTSSATEPRPEALVGNEAEWPDVDDDGSSWDFLGAGGYQAWFDGEIPAHWSEHVRFSILSVARDENAPYRLIIDARVEGLYLARLFSASDHLDYAKEAEYLDAHRAAIDAYLLDNYGVTRVEEDLEEHGVDLAYFDDGDGTQVPRDAAGVIEFVRSKTKIDRLSDDLKNCILYTDLRKHLDALDGVA